MSFNLCHRAIWLADTIYRAGRITFAEINRRWLLNNLSEGKPIPAADLSTNTGKVVETAIDPIPTFYTLPGFNSVPAK